MANKPLIPSTLEERIARLEQHLNYQIDENRKIGRQLDLDAKRMDALEALILNNRDSIGCMDSAYDEIVDKHEDRLNELEDAVGQGDIVIGNLQADRDTFELRILELEKKVKALCETEKQKWYNAYNAIKENKY